MIKSFYVSVGEVDFILLLHSLLALVQLREYLLNYAGQSLHISAPEVYDC